MSLKVTLDRDSLVYKSGETVTGKVAILNQANTQHAGLSVAVKGTLHLLPRKEQSGVEQVYTVLRKTKQLMPGGKILGNTEIDFSLLLQPESDYELYETYHGRHVAVEYVVIAELTRTGLKKALRTSVDFILQTPSNDEGKEVQKAFEIKDIGGIPDSLIKGHLQTLVIDIAKPIEGEIEIVSAPVIEEILLQVVRYEKITTPEINLESVSDAQTLEVVTGNIERNVKVPLYCILQKFVVSPSLETNKFKVSYMLRLSVKYKDQSSNSREHYFDIPVRVQRLRN